MRFWTQFATLAAALLLLPQNLAYSAAAHSASSANFEVRSYRNGPAATDILNRCESLRSECRRVWLALKDDSAWQPRCSIVLHPTRASYLQAVGRGGSQTSGSSLVRFEGERVVVRRVDLLVDRDGATTALAHELTHVVLADRFGARRPPLWLDEGIATFADAAGKQRLHDRDCRHALENGSAMRLTELLRVEQITSADQVPAFYGQSLSLVRFLAERAEPANIVDFAVTANEVGHDRALKKVYGIDGVADLEHQWKEVAVTRKQVPPDTRVAPAVYRP